MPEKTLLYVEDDEALARVTAAALQRHDFNVAHFATVEQAKTAIVARSFSHALLDLKVGNDNSLALIEPLRNAHPDCRILVLTGYGSIATAVKAIKLGGDNYLTKPASVDDILQAFESEASVDAELAEHEPQFETPSLKQLEWESIQQALAANNGNVSATARQLKMHRRTLQRKLQKKPGNSPV